MDKQAHAAFVKHVQAIGSLVHDGLLSTAGARKALWGDGQARGLSEEVIEWEIGKVLDDDEPRATNGHDASSAAEEPPPHTKIPEGADTEQKQKPLIISSADFVSGFIPPDYLVDGLLQKRFCYSITGPTGSGKSAIALLFSAHVALGRPIAERGVETGRVLYLAGENPDDIRMRWIAMADQMEFDIDTIGVHFLPGVFKVSEIAGRIKKEVEKIGMVAMVVVDTSAAYFEGDDENNNVQQGAHARRLRALTTLPGGPTVLIACHPVKNATIDNLIPKGGGNFINEVDGNLTAWKTDSATAVHWQGKFRGAEFAPLTFQLRTATTDRLTDSKGRLVPTVVAVAISENEQIKIETKSRSDEDQLLVSILENERTSLKAHAVILGWKTKSGEPNKTLVNRVASNLKKGKLVTMERRGLALTAKGTQEAKLVKSNLARAGELISRDKL
jgi:hypothetical protein